jgi:hypothetical protein
LERLFIKNLRSPERDVVPESSLTSDGDAETGSLDFLEVLLSEQAVSAEKIARDQIVE